MSSIWRHGKALILWFATIWRPSFRLQRNCISCWWSCWWSSSGDCPELSWRCWGRSVAEIAVGVWTLSVYQIRGNVAVIAEETIRCTRRDGPDFRDRIFWGWHLQVRAPVRWHDQWCHQAWNSLWRHDSPRFQTAYRSEHNSTVNVQGAAWRDHQLQQSAQNVDGPKCNARRGSACKRQPGAIAVSDLTRARVAQVAKGSPRRKARAKSEKRKLTKSSRVNGGTAWRRDTRKQIAARWSWTSHLVNSARPADRRALTRS